MGCSLNSFMSLFLTFLSSLNIFVIVFLNCFSAILSKSLSLVAITMVLVIFEGDKLSWLFMDLMFLHWDLPIWSKSVG